MRRRPKRKSSRFRMISLISALLILLCIIVTITEKKIHPVAQLRAEHFAQRTASDVISAAVTEYLNTNRFTYEDFAAVLYNDNKEPVSIEVIPFTVNKVQSELAIAINQKLETSAGRSAKIPLGSLSDSTLLTGKGPSIRIRVCPVGAADVSLKSEFTDAGLNQTCHRISAVVTVHMTSSVPMYSFNVSSEFEFILAESIIVGEVPKLSPYLKGNGKAVSPDTA